MLDALRRPGTLLLVLCLALAAPAARAQEPLPSMPPEEEGADPQADAQADPQTPPADPPPTTPEASGTQAPPATGTPEPAFPRPGRRQPPGPPPLPPEERIDFNLQFPPDKGGGSAAGSAASLEYQRDDYAVLAGSVRIKYQDVDLQADRAEIDLSTKVVTARGHVIVDQGPRRLSGETAVYNLDTKTGTLTEATAHVAPDYYFQGDQIAKVGESSYTVTNGMFTSCNQEVPDWSFRLGEARVEVESYAHVRNASMRAKRLPVFYTPYILWPVKTDRSSGLLIPNFGYSDRRGASLGLAYYQILGRSYDTTVHLDLFSENYLGVGNELRYRPSEGTRGDVIAYAVRDPAAVGIPGTTVEDEWRWKVEWNHVTNDLPRGMRGMVHFQDFSDFNFFRDFERDFDRNTLRFIDSRASVTGNWGPHLLNFLLNDRETLISFDQSVEQRRLPEIEYRLRQTRLGRTPLYLQFEGSASYLDLFRPDAYEGTYGRVDLFPQLTLPVRSFPWLSLSLTGGERLTWYSDSLETTEGVSSFAGEPLSRAVPFGSSQIVGPSFSRIFDRQIGGFARFKHVIEPRFTYTFLGELDERDEASIPLFDEVDTLFSTNNGRVALINRVLAKPKGEKANAREVVYFELARGYSFDEEQPLQQGPGVIPGTTVISRAGPLEALARFNPAERISFKLEASYNTLFSGLSSRGLSGSYGFGRGNNLGATWYTRYRPETGETTGDQVRLFGGVNLLPRKLRLEGQVNYDLEQQLLQQQRYILNWTAQCYGVRLELRDFRTGGGIGGEPRVSDKDFRFALTLKNVGTFLELTSRSSTTVEP